MYIYSMSNVFSAVKINDFLDKLHVLLQNKEGKQWSFVAVEENKARVLLFHS